jgi:hypothetical protein
MNILIFTFGSVAVIILFSCLAIAKQADERRNVIFADSGNASARLWSSARSPQKSQ